MPTTYKVLGQLAAASAVTATETIYAVPAATQAVISTLSVCNTSTVSTTYRVAVRPVGTAVTGRHYIVYDATIPANDSVYLTLGISLGPTDVLAAFAGNAFLTFNAFGAEIT